MAATEDPAGQARRRVELNLISAGKRFPGRWNKLDPQVVSKVSGV